MSEHPKDRAWEPEDPMLMHGNATPGEPEAMLQCLVEEYGRQGWNSEQIVRLFESPFFQATFDLGRRLTGEGIRSRVEQILARTGVLRFRTVHATPDSSEVSEQADCGSCQGGKRNG
ncbi:MAG: hypothetical protein HY303_03635 [Candidatus Wallbacteria bacterium]|nr:hypothetical protein [Candidatus Wallbacteria bacterium]